MLTCGHTAPGDATADGRTDCPDCDRRVIPPAAIPARRTSTFTSETVPKGLLRAHLTTAWAELVVLEGTVVFVDETALEIVATPANRVAIVPGRRHHIEPEENAEFYVQFYDLDPEQPEPRPALVRGTDQLKTRRSPLRGGTG